MQESEKENETGHGRRNLGKLFRSTKELDEPQQTQILGNIPKWLSGSILRVGPGFFDFQDFTMKNYLDGYAVLSKFEISGQCVKFHKRFLQSDSYKRALKAQRPVLTEFGTKAYPEKGKGLFARFVSAIMPEMSDNNISNVFQFGQDFYVSNDACYFRRIDSNLNSKERYDSNKLFGVNGWTSHPLTDSKGDTYNIGFSILTGLKFFVIKIPPAASACESSKETFKNASILCTIPSSYNGGISYVHSFGMTDEYIILIEQPYVATVSAIAMALIKGYSASEWMRWMPSQKNYFWIIEKSTGRILKNMYCCNEAFFFLHFVNCYMVNNAELVVDLIAMDNPSILDGMQLCKLRNNLVEKVAQPSCRRFVIPIQPQSLTMTEGSNALTNNNNLYCKAIYEGTNRFSLFSEVLTESGCEMPCINRKYFGLPYNYFYVSGTIEENSFSHSISKIDLGGKEVRVWKGADYYYPGEPIFVPNPEAKSESDGVLISVVTDCRGEDHFDFLLFLDAESMVEIGRAMFKDIPGALHGIFV